jgi:hypothetical protein
MIGECRAMLLELIMAKTDLENAIKSGPSNPMLAMVAKMLGGGKG